MLDYKTADKMKIYQTFDLAYQTDAKSFSNPKELYNYFKTLYDMYKDGNQGYQWNNCLINMRRLLKNLS